jgi:Protein of unknown function (DUF3105)
MPTKPKAKPQPKKSRLPPWLTIDRAIIGGSVLLTVIIIGVIALNGSRASYVDNLTIDGVQQYAVLSSTHVDGTVNYPQTPPVGGAHSPVWQNCGVYTQPLINEHAVHALEHGAVWITYQLGLPADQLQKLQDITRQSSHRLLSPYPGIDSPIILSAWGYQLKLPNADDPRLMQFIQKFEQGPTTPELGAVCSGGTSITAGS